MSDQNTMLFRFTFLLWLLSSTILAIPSDGSEVIAELPLDKTPIAKACLDITEHFLNQALK